MVPSLGDWCYQRRKTLSLVGAAAVAAYCTHKWYTSQRAAELKAYVLRLGQAGEAVTGACVSSAEVIQLLSSDLHGFLTSNSSEVPQSFIQLMKLVQHKDVQHTIQTTVKSAVASTLEEVNASILPSVMLTVDKIISATLSEQGKSVISLAVGMAAKNAVTAFCQYLASMQSQGLGSPSAVNAVEQLVTALTSTEGERLLRTLIAVSTTSAVGTYVDKTAHINVMDDCLTSLAREDHLIAVKTLVACMCRVFVQEVATCYSTGLLTATNTPSSPSSSQTQPPHAAPPSRRPSMTDACSTSLPHHQPPTLDEPHHRPVSFLPQPRLPAWLDSIVMLTRQPEVQNLAISLTKSTVHEVVDTLVNADGPGAKNYVGLSVSKMYTVLSVASALLLYAVSA